MSIKMNNKCRGEVTSPLPLIHGVGKKSFIDILKKERIREVFVMEGRPHLQGARVLCKALLKEKITPTLISDNMAGFLFYKNLVKEVWVGYQSVNGDKALCEIGALLLGVLGKRHKIQVNLFPFARKRKELGKTEDITCFNSKRIAPLGVKGYVPLLENLSKQYITGMIIF
jgi:methylthioribose-1-phosphate isomerase